MENVVSRKVNSAKSIAFAMISNIVNIILQFLLRSVFIYVLGVQYLGLKSIFAGILNILSLSELGVSTAVAFNLYKPVSENDTQKINSILNIYKKLYLIVGMVIFFVGVAIIPFLHYIVTDITDVNVDITLAYLLTLFATVSPYFFAYRNVLFTVYQHKYKESIVTTLTNLLSLLAQTLVVLLFKDYYAYLIACFILVVLSDCVLYTYSRKIYKNIRPANALPLDNETKVSLKNNIKGMVLHKISYAVLQGADSVIISAFISTLILGIYSNYTSFTNAILLVFSIISTSILGSVGNLIVEGDTEKSYKVFKYLRFAFFWLAGFCSISLFCLINPTITLWSIFSGWDLSVNWTFDTFTVFIIVANFYLNSSRIITSNFRTAIGMFDKDKWKGLIEAILNIVFSLLLVKPLGLAGILLGTILSVGCMSLIVDPYMVYKYHFKRPLKSHFCYIFVYTIVVALVGGLTFFLCSLLPGEGVWNFVFKALTCLVVPNLCFLLLSFRTKEFKNLVAIIKSFFKRKNKDSIQE